MQLNSKFPGPNSESSLPHLLLFPTLGQQVRNYTVLLDSSLFLGETTGSTLQRKVVKIKRANRCKASKTLEIIFSFLFLTCLSLHPAEYMALYRAGVREKAKGPTTKRGAMRLTSSVHLLTILCMAPMFHGHETLQLQAVLCLQRILSVIHLKSPGLGISDNTQPHLLVMDSCKSRLP